MPILGKAALAVWLECLPAAEGDFNRWYVEEHMAERVGLPGFLRGRRHEAMRGAPRYFAFYETEGVDALRSPAYEDRLAHPTEWTRRVMPNVRNFTRGVYRRLDGAAAPGGPEDARLLVTARLETAPDRAAAVRTAYPERVLPQMVKVPGILSAALYELDAQATGGTPEERRIIGSKTMAPPFVCLAEARDAAAVDHAAWRALFAPDGPAGGDLARNVIEGVYRFMHGLTHGAAQPA